MEGANTSLALPRIGVHHQYGCLHLEELLLRDGGGRVWVWGGGYWDAGICFGRCDNFRRGVKVRFGGLRV